MRAAVLHAIGGDLSIVDVTIDDPHPREVVVDVRACGICHSDLSMANTDYGKPFPLILGHEAAGVVSRIGSEVTAVDVGDHVVACLMGFCGRCASCAAGDRYLCRQPQSTLRSADAPPRLSLDGTSVFQLSGLAGFAEQMLVHENNLVRVNDAIPFDRAALLGCGVITGAGAAINTASVRVGDNVAVIGCGAIGLSVLEGARLAGANTIIAIDIHRGKLDLARGFGATHIVDASEGDVLQRVRELTDGGVDHAFEAVGTPQTARLALDLAAMGAAAYMIGMQTPGTRVELDPFADLVLSRKSLHGVYMGSTDFRTDIPRYADLYVDGRFNLDDLVSDTISLEDLDGTLKKLRDGADTVRTVVAF